MKLFLFFVFFFKLCPYVTQQHRPQRNLVHADIIPGTVTALTLSTSLCNFMTGRIQREPTSISFVYIAQQVLQQTFLFFFFLTVTLFFFPAQIWYYHVYCAIFTRQHVFKVNLVFWVKNRDSGQSLPMVNDLYGSSCDNWCVVQIWAVNLLIFQGVI